MKKLLLSALMSGSMLLNAQIPNAGFEDWTEKTLFGIRYTDPTGWHSSNYGLVAEGMEPAVSATNDAYMGQKAMKITNVFNDYHSVGYATTMRFEGLEFVDKFPIQMKPTKLKGYFKYLYTQKDTFSITVSVYKNGLNIGYGQMYHDSMVSAYTPFDINIEYYGADSTVIPDSASIAIACSQIKEDTMNLGVELFLDELSFDGITTSVNKTDKGNIEATIFPNPVIDIVRIQFEQKIFGYSEIVVYDILGNEVEALHKKSHTPVGMVEVEWDTQKLNSGIYFVKIVSGDNSKTIRVKMN